MRSMTSATTGALSRISERAEKQTGTALSLTNSERSPRGGGPLAERLLQSDSTEANDKAILASLTQRHGCSLTATTEYTPKAIRPRTVMGYTLTMTPGSDVAGAIDVVRKGLTGPDTDMALAWLGELSAKCAVRNQSDFSGELTLKVYARELLAYPADVVRDVLSEWARKSKWWPTWNELYTLLEDATRPRSLMLYALETYGFDDQRMAAFMDSGEWQPGWGLPPDNPSSRFHWRWIDERARKAEIDRADRDQGKEPNQC